MAKSLLRRGENLEPGMQCPRPCPQQEAAAALGSCCLHSPGPSCVCQGLMATQPEDSLFLAEERQSGLILISQMCYQRLFLLK